MMHGLFIHNSFWHSASMDKMEALFAHAAEELQIQLTFCGNSDLLCSLPVSAMDGLNKTDFVLFWDKDVRLAAQLEHGGLPVFNSSRAIQLCDDKTLTHLALQHLPMPKTVLCPSTFAVCGYTKTDFLLKIEDLLHYPMVIKEGCGSFGQQVYLAHNREQTLEILQKHAGSPLLMQEYIAESAGHDKRLYMVNGVCRAAMMRTNDRDFRANIAIGGTAVSYVPSEEEIRLAQEACRALGLTFAGVDILDSRRGPLICEVNSNAHFTALQQLTGVDMAHHILTAIRGAL